MKTKSSSWPTAVAVEQRLLAQAQAVAEVAAAQGVLARTLAVALAVMAGIRLSKVRRKERAYQDEVRLVVMPQFPALVKMASAVSMVVAVGVPLELPQ